MVWRVGGGQGRGVGRGPRPLVGVTTSPTVTLKLSRLTEHLQNFLYDLRKVKLMRRMLSHFQNGNRVFRALI